MSHSAAFLSFTVKFITYFFRKSFFHVFTLQLSKVNIKFAKSMRFAKAWTKIKHNK